MDTAWALHMLDTTGCIALRRSPAVTIRVARTPRCARPAHPLCSQASPDELTGVSEPGRTAPRAAVSCVPVQWPVPPGAAALSPAPPWVDSPSSSLDRLVDAAGVSPGGGDFSPQLLARGLDHSARRNRRPSREVTGLDAVTESTAGVFGGDLSPLAASPLFPTALPAIRTGGALPASS